MKIQEAVAAFSQSEKIKSGLIWLTQVLELSNTLTEPEQRGSVKAIRFMVGLLDRESRITARLSSDPTWSEVQKHLNLSMVMMDSGVPQEAGFHFTRALTQVTNIGLRALTVLKDQGIME